MPPFHRSCPRRYPVLCSPVGFIRYVCEIPRTIILEVLVVHRVVGFLSRSLAHALITQQCTLVPSSKEVALYSGLQISPESKIRCPFRVIAGWLHVVTMVSKSVKLSTLSQFLPPPTVCKTRPCHLGPQCVLGKCFAQEPTCGPHPARGTFHRPADEPGHFFMDAVLHLVTGSVDPMELGPSRNKPCSWGTAECFMHAWGMMHSGNFWSITCGGERDPANSDYRKRTLFHARKHLLKPTNLKLTRPSTQSF